ncbi:unnamed protein product [Musa acuminata subsp. burmannicoides]
MVIRLESAGMLHFYPHRPFVLWPSLLSANSGTGRRCRKLLIGAVSLNLLLQRFKLKIFQIRVWVLLDQRRRRRHPSHETYRK